MGNLKTDVAYGMRLRLHMSNLRNAGYPKNAKNRYKTVDVSNRIKLLEDAIAEAGGFDDSQIFSLTVEKVESDREYCEVYIWEIPPEPSEPHAPTPSR
jgi:Holliday junction resolvase RusA-like endonuclease